MTDPDSRNRIIIVGAEFRQHQLEALARLSAMMDPAMMDMPARHRELPPPVAFMPREPRRERHRDWEDRKKPRPNLKRARQKAQKQARQRNRRGR
jgi:hypothetical protein